MASELAPAKKSSSLAYNWYLINHNFEHNYLYDLQFVQLVVYNIPFLLSHVGSLVYFAISKTDVLIQIVFFLLNVIGPSFYVQ